MPTVSRILDEHPVRNLSDHLAAGGGRGFEAALRLGPAATIDEVDASGLRGRGGAGFPTGRKWRTVAENRSDVLPTSIVINASEGEPGSFKDRALLRRNPYRVVEGALIAAHAVGADAIVFALKTSFHAELGRLRTAIDEIRAAGWDNGVGIAVLEGPSEYLYGEETALLEVVNGRAPFPRLAPPYRQGADVIGEDPTTVAEIDMAAPGDASPVPPSLVNNVETIAHVPVILADGPQTFRALGTDRSPGTIVCTVTGRTRRHGVGEFPMGTPLSEVIDVLGGGPAGQRITAVLSGVAHPLLPGSKLDVPLTYEDMDAAGSGLGAAGFIVFDETVDLVAAAHGVARFLAVESCGQCTPCKQDGLAIADLLDRVRRNEATEADVQTLAAKVVTVADGARCYLATQQQRVIASLLELFPDELQAHLEGGSRSPAGVELIAPIVDLDGDRAVLAETHWEKQPDWTYGPDFSGQSPADRIDQRATSGAR